MSLENDQYPPKSIIRLCKLIGFVTSKLFWRIEFIGLENIPAQTERGLIIAPNHQTYCDPVWVCLKVDRNFRFMAWDAVFDWLIVGRLIRFLGAFPVALDRKGQISAMRKAKEVLREGATLIIFPEGEREFADGKLLEFKPGAVRLAMVADVPILPVTIRGANRIWSRDHKFPQFGKVEVIYHKVLEVQKISGNGEVRSLVEKANWDLMRIIGSGLSDEKA